MFVNHKKINQKGFGILEVVITIFLIGVTLLLFQVVSNSVVLNKYNKYKEVALRVAEHQLQDLRTTPYGSLPASGSFNNSQLSEIPNGAGQMTLTEVQDGLTEAVVTVTWNNTTGTGSQQVSFSSYIWQGGLGK